MNVVMVKPGQREAFAYRYRTAAEIYVGIDDAGRVKLDDSPAVLGGSGGTCGVLSHTGGR